MFGWLPLNGWQTGPDDCWHHEALPGLTLRKHEATRERVLWAATYGRRALGTGATERECVAESGARASLWAQALQEEAERYNAMAKRPRLQIVGAAFFGNQDHHPGMYALEPTPEAHREAIERLQHLSAVLNRMVKK